ncbi:hypothetical protein TorRG33x02_221730 [Trema orientale]|uniref:Uncharacterized protein n=1 Tax=Trema orientale TaxID=63057 RepID=A0A2P5E942_TREOI|nr:hypothetical protein TorRG33x02_221730 [Trema orientale]
MVSSSVNGTQFSQQEYRSCACSRRPVEVEKDHTSCFGAIQADAVWTLETFLW